MLARFVLEYCYNKEIKGIKMTTRFENRTIQPKIAIAILKATELLERFSPMILELLRKDDFGYDSGLGHSVVIKLLQAKKPIGVYTYRKRFTAAVGYFDGEAIHINLAKIDSMGESDIVGLLLHEYSHYSGFHHTDAGFWGRRRSNYKTENKVLYSVPYFISENISRWV